MYVVGVDIPAHSQSNNQLVFEGLGLSNGRETTVGDTLSIELHGSLTEVESLLDNRGQLSDAASLLSQDVLGAGGSDDDLSPGGGHTDLHT